METTRRQLLSAAGAACLFPRLAISRDAWPERMLRFVVPFPAGGGTDILARTTARGAERGLGQSVVVENRDGAGGTIGADSVARMPADGYAMLMGASSTMSVNPHLYKKLPYVTTRDFTAVTLLATCPLILAVNANLPVRSVRELIDYAKKHPGKLNTASAGTGSVGHLTSALFRRMADIDITHVPYRGSSPAINALLSGEVHMMFDSPLTILPQVGSGRLVPLASTGEKRAATLPDLPTMAESGLPGFKTNLWYGLFVRSGTPRPVVRRLNAEFVRALREPAMRETLARQNLEPVGNTPEAFDAFWKSEYDRWGRVIRTDDIVLG
ncbi:tripartite tricarboxylate transporter substrate binding protein [Pigmentiphaga soli]|uniref:Tripartite tricarboxylate transporter substrate binding protein n=2 Tax=Pigmentiphaga soli TaxID=1007095 RepID=A0ABP8HIF5_9BURK